MKKNNCIESLFLKNIARHAMTVLRDDGVNRHIRFKRPDRGIYWFDLVTWPGVLCIDGDCGTYVFKRTNDMFAFFRTDREYLERWAVDLAINPSYWSEKLVAPNYTEAMEFSADSFRQHVKEAFDNWVESSQQDEIYSPSESELKRRSKRNSELWEELEDKVLSLADDGEIRAFDAARDFKSDHGYNFNLEDCWEWNCREFKSRFVWCCYAIAWGVKTYDESKNPATPPEAQPQPECTCLKGLGPDYCERHAA
jgi:hypothetical protein